MSVQEACRVVAAGTIAPGGTAVYTILMEGAPSLSGSIKNTGATNNIDTVTVESTPLGNLPHPEDDVTTALAAITPGETRGFSANDLSVVSIRFTLASTSGTSYAIEMRGGF